MIPSDKRTNGDLPSFERCDIFDDRIGHCERVIYHSPSMTGRPGITMDLKCVINGKDPDSINLSDQNTRLVRDNSQYQGQCRYLLRREDKEGNLFYTCIKHTLQQVGEELDGTEYDERVLEERIAKHFKRLTDKEINISPMIKALSDLGLEINPKTQIISIKEIIRATYF